MGNGGWVGKGEWRIGTVTVTGSHLEIAQHVEVS
jgi:hypothetical protein